MINQDYENEILQLQLQNRALQERAEKAEKELTSAHEHAWGETEHRQRLEKQLAEVLPMVQGYIQEIEKIATGAKTILEQCEVRQKEGDRLRIRLAKVTDVMEAADQYILALEAYAQVETQLQLVADLKMTYSQVKLKLSTSDEPATPVPVAPVFRGDRGPEPTEQ